MNTVRYLLLGWLLLLPNLAMALPHSVISLVTNGLFEPYGVSMDTSNNFVYLSDNSHRVFQYVYANGVLKPIAGQQGLPGTNNGPGFLARFYAPKGMALYGGGLVVADSGNHWLRFITLSNNAVPVVTNFAGVPSSNQPGQADNGRVKALEARFNSPLGLTADGTNLFVADAKNNAIRRLYPDPDSTGYVVETLKINFALPTAPLFEPSYVAVGEAGVLFVADTRNHGIRKLISQGDGTYQAYLLAGSAKQTAGTNDAYFASEALFNQPVGLLWQGTDKGLLVADTGNHTIRQLFVDPDLTEYFDSNVWRVVTYTGKPKLAGWLDGLLEEARFKSPVQIAPDRGNGVLVVDSGNQALRRIQPGPIKPAVTDPIIGWVDWGKDKDGQTITTLVPITDEVFFEEKILAILGEANSVMYTEGPIVDGEDTVVDPGPGSGSTPPDYANGWVKGEHTLQSLISSFDDNPDIADMSIRAVGMAEGRRPSAVVAAHVSFRVATPQIIGDNPGGITLMNSTEKSKIYYILQDVGLSVPTEIPRTNQAGPYASGDVLNLDDLTQDMTLVVQAFRDHWKSSSVSTKRISPLNYSANRISLGFENGEASSSFTGSPGQRFFAPITLTLLPSQRMYSLQFNVRVAGMDAAPLVNPSSLTFTSMLWKPLPGISPKIYVRINPLMTVVNAETNISTSERMVEDVSWTSQVLEQTVTNYDIVNIPMVTNITYTTNYVDMGYITNLLSKTNLLSQNIIQIGTNASVDLRTTNFFVVTVDENVLYLTLTNASTGVIKTTNWTAVTNIVYISSSTTNYSFNEGQTNLVLVDTNAPYWPNSSILLAGWFERYGRTNLYDTLSQDLLANSMAHNHMYDSLAGKAIVGAFSFLVPANAQNGVKYLVQIGRPSATSDGVDTDINIECPTNGALQRGLINSIKHVVIQPTSYLVGDSAPFRWLNAGDFGDGSILNNDLVDLFQYVAYSYNPPMEGSDFFDAMDSASNLGLYDVSDGSEQMIDSMKLGDGQLGVDDIYVTYRRSLDPARKWFTRTHVYGTSLPVVAEVPNTFRVKASLPVRRTSHSAADLPADVQTIRQSTAKPFVQFEAGNVQAVAGQTITVPISARITGRFPIRVLLMNLNVAPMNGAPPLTAPIRFDPAPGLDKPLFTTSESPGNYSATWLDNTVAGIWGNGRVGSLTLTIPAGTPASGCYRIEFAKVSASPAGIGVFPQSLQSGMVSLASNLVSSWADGIPDIWRLRYFGTLTDPMSQATADPDGDGVSNWAEYRAGTDPTDANSALRLQTRLVATGQNAAGAPQVALRWLSVEGKRYLLEAAASIEKPSWTTVGSELTGTGADLEFVAPDTAANPGKYYRLRVAE